MEIFAVKPFTLFYQHHSGPFSGCSPEFTRLLYNLLILRSKQLKTKSEQRDSSGSARGTSLHQARISNRSPSNIKGNPSAYIPKMPYTITEKEKQQAKLENAKSVFLGIMTLKVGKETEEKDIEGNQSSANSGRRTKIEQLRDHKRRCQIEALKKWEEILTRMVERLELENKSTGATSSQSGAHRNEESYLNSLLKQLEDEELRDFLQRILAHLGREAGFGEAYSRTSRHPLDAKGPGDRPRK